MVCRLPHSPSTRPLARPPRDTSAAPSRACGHGSARWQHPGRPVHTDVQVGVLCAHNGTQHQPKHTNTPHAWERPILGSFPRAHAGNDPWKHGSPIAHARHAPHKPLLPNTGQPCNMSATMSAGCHTLPHTRTAATRCESMASQPSIRAREQRARRPRAQQHAAVGTRQRSTLFCCPCASLVLFPCTSAGDRACDRTNVC